MMGRRGIPDGMVMSCCCCGGCGCRLRKRRQQDSGKQAERLQDKARLHARVSAEAEDGSQIGFLDPRSRAGGCGCNEPVEVNAWLILRRRSPRSRMDKEEKGPEAV